MHIRDIFYMKYFALMLLLFFHSNAHSKQSLICNIDDENKNSELKIEYKDQTPTALYLRSPNSDVYRPMLMNITSIATGDKSLESFVAQPQEPIVDWDKEPLCFKEIGSQWHFEFWHSKKIWTVHIYPYLMIKNQSCITPRFRPQTKRLICEYK